jgi:hypothetical protein
VETTAQLLDGKMQISRKGAKAQRRDSETLRNLYGLIAAIGRAGRWNLSVPPFYLEANDRANVRTLLAEVRSF